MTKSNSFLGVSREFPFHNTVDPRLSGPQLSSTSLIYQLLFGYALGKNHTHRLIFANSAIENVLFQLSRHLSRVMYRLYHEVERPEVVSIA